MTRASDDPEQGWISALLDQIPVPLTVVEMGTARVLFSNVAADRLLGPMAEGSGDHEVVYGTTTDVQGDRISNDSLPAVRAAHGELISGEQVVWYGSRGPRTVMVQSGAITARAGRPAAVVIAWQDISELKQAEQDVAESARQFRLLAEAMPQMVWKAGADGRLAYHNPRWSDYVGEGERSAWLEVVHPGDRPLAAERWQRCLESGDDFEVWARLRHHDDAYRWHVVRARAVRDVSGRVTRWFGTATDVDDEQRATRASALLARLGAAMVDALDLPSRAQGIAGTCVPDLGEICGVYLADEAGEISLVGVAAVAPVLVDAARERLGRGEAHAITRAVRTGQAQLDRREISVPLVARGRSIGALSVAAPSGERCYDATDLRLAEEVGRRVALAIDNIQLLELAQHERTRAEEANRIKDDFLANLSHELRTPLTAVLGWARLLREGTLDADRRARALESIERNAVAQKQLIDDLLDVSRIVAGKLHLEPAQMNLAQVIESALDAVRPSAEAKRQTLHASLDPEAGSVIGDAARLRQVAQNLLANAVKFTPARGTIEVRLSRGRDGIELTVRDDGEGIDPSFLPHVFDRFRMADAGITRRHGGLGLGLAIARCIVELSGGTIEAQSEGRGQGATFTVRLPIQPPRSERAPRQHGASPSVPDLQGLRVLAVDDEADTRGLVATLLELSGAVVEQADGAAAALASIERGVPDVMISDVAMPGEDGLSLLRGLRKLPPERGGAVRAVALTAYARSEDRARALAAGFDAHVGKPIDPAELLTVVARLRPR